MYGGDYRRRLSSSRVCPHPPTRARCSLVPHPYICCTRRSLRFTNDGRYLACAEPADFVRIYDVLDNFHSCQEIDLFGEVSGISFSPCGDSLFVGIADRVYGSMMQFRRKRRGEEGVPPLMYILSLLLIASSPLASAHSTPLPIRRLCPFDVGISKHSNARLALIPSACPGLLSALDWCP